MRNGHAAVTSRHHAVTGARERHGDDPRYLRTMTTTNAATTHVLTILAVEDLACARTFYERAFGWRVIVDAPTYVELGVDGGMRFGMYDRVAFGRNTGDAPVAIPAGRLAPVELYFWSDDVANSIARLEEAGARRLSALATRDWGDEAAYYADPDGNVLVIARPIRS
jgi:catechol 2,3-dioxygenase-like lactoylglutathione lyase family enzyme